jgi:hypothetical protein
MGEGSRLMFERAIAQGVRFAVGYVGLDNLPQLRATARTGAIPDHLCVIRWRFGRRRVDRRELDAGTMAFWHALTTANPASPAASSQSGVRPAVPQE